MALLTVQSVGRAGLEPVLVAAAAGGDTFPLVDGREWIEVNNASAGAVTITIKSKQKCDQGFDHDLVISVPAGKKRVISGFLPISRFQNANGNLEITYSAVASVTVGAFRAGGV
jgi:hypothetical protein